MAQLGGQPILILSEGSRRTVGRDAQRMNITAGRVVAEAVRTTLGPKGMDKMLVDNLGDVVITNDGATILGEMDIQHPAAKMLVEVSKAQEDEVGDGTTTAVVIAGELLKRAEDLLDQDIHPTVIVRGYKLGNEKAQEVLGKIGENISSEDRKSLENIAITAMTGKSAERASEPLAKLAVDAVLRVADKVDGKLKIDKDNVKVEKKQGGSIADSELILGVIIDKERVHSGMAEHVKNAKVALLDAAIEIKETETDAEIQITDPSKLKDFLDQEEKMLKDMVEKVKKSGANVLFCQKGIDDVAQHYLAKAGIFAVRRAKKSDMEKLARATGGRVVSSLEDLSEKDLGHAGNVEEKKIAGEKMVFVTDCKNPKAVSILIRGGTDHVVDEVNRALDDAIGGVTAALEVGKIVGGGGSVEMEVAKHVKDYAQQVGGREQLALNAFAEAIESIPRALAENAGLDPIDVLVNLRSVHEKSGNKWMGIDVFDGKTKNMFDLGVIEPLKIKTQAIKSASEAAEMILRIDDVISAKSGGGGGAPGGMPGGMPGGEEGGEYE
ncbi:TPA: TCP-1/cpn60 chaperonin family protein [archaeon]|uniref:TCP-1/cpn60 chaperonin family protein n=1 Tax=Candidatus Naiadarchaeum limnaeum TaxID=2756139 RepID=A0A832V2V1_9ARCH|nr:TCP-1/cpn60 chaperonin family protein [Candidatus Naiadarchaeum limnaeum]